MISERDAFTRFLALRVNQKTAIAAQLGLADDVADRGLSDFDRFARVFRRARDRGLVHALWRLAREAEADR